VASSSDAKSAKTVERERKIGYKGFGFSVCATPFHGRRGSSFYSALFFCLISIGYQLLVYFVAIFCSIYA